MNDYGRYFRGERSANNLWEIIRLFLHGLIFLPIICLQAWAVIETPFDAMSVDLLIVAICFSIVAICLSVLSASLILRSLRDFMRYLLIKWIERRGRI